MGPASQTDIGLPSNSQTLTLPKLDVDGSNWVLYKVRVLSVLTYRRIICHVDGCAQKPTTPTNKADAAAMEKYKTALEMWEIGNEHAHSVILSTLPETYQIEVVGLESAKETWDLISSKFDNQSEMVQIDLLRQMNQTHCAEDADPRETIQALQTL